MTASKNAEPTVALLALPETTPTALFGLLEVFLSVGNTWEALTGEPSLPGRLAPIIVAKNTRPIASPVGIDIVPQSELMPADVVIVTDLAINQSFEPVGLWQDETAWVRDQYERGAIVCSVCTGAVFLAETGLLDGVTATTHWSATGLMERYYPKVALAPERILTVAGDGERLITGGGSSSWEELALYLVARLCGTQEAVRMSKIFLFGDKSDGQLPFAGARQAHRHEDVLIADAQSWIARNYAHENAVSEMMARSGLPDRTFSRRFRAATGYSSIDYVQTLRVEEAKQILLTEKKAVDDIAFEVGYADPTYFRRLFKRRTGTTPSKYRQRFSRIGRLN